MVVWANNNSVEALPHGSLISVALAVKASKFNSQLPETRRVA
jgi:hypothetical protein